MQVSCCICKNALQGPSCRRIISPVNASNSKVRGFFLRNICAPSYRFSEDSQYYVCRLTCFRSLEKAAKLQDDLDSLVAELRVHWENSSEREEPKEVRQQ